MKKPNLFIIGAPKCGTTSLYNALARHSLVQPAQNKEPNYYATDLYVPSRIKEAEYFSLYNDAPASSKWFMDGSTRYLYSNIAIDNILDDQPDAKFIALVRNPVDMLYSLHNHLVFLGVEGEKDFGKAWLNSFNLDRNTLIAKGCTDPDSLIYPKIGLLGEQIKRMNEKVNPEKRIVVFYEELCKAPESVVNKILDFLGLEYETGLRIAKDNESMASRSDFLLNSVHVAASVKRTLGITGGLGILNRVIQLNKKKKLRKLLSDDVSHKIKSYFADDIRLLGNETKKDLSNWLSM